MAFVSQGRFFIYEKTAHRSFQLSKGATLMEGLELFKSRFSFTPQGVLLVGVERECFLVDKTGQIVPKASLVIQRAIENKKVTEPELPGYNGDKRLFAGDPIGYELSACQIEMRTMPTATLGLRQALESPERELNRILEELDLQALHLEVAPADMPLTVYPDPTGRYAEITRAMPHEVLLAACRVAGTHIHVGMPDHETALRVYNSVISHTERLCWHSGATSPERLQIYSIVAPEREPRPYVNWEDFFGVACEKGFAENPRNCWTIIRISVHGTIEFRMFGATPSIDQILLWASHCRLLCLEAM